MGLFINTNVAALNAQRNLLTSSTSVGRSFQRLSSGLRINSAKDDAAGLAISTRMTAQVRGLNQAVRNTNDGISLAQTAEGALQETTNILQRMRELSVQAANDTNTTTDRESIQAEIDQLVAEIDRIAETTQFNNQNVLDGSFSGAKFHVGANSHQTIQLKTTDGRANILGRQARYDADPGVTVGDAAFADGDLLINDVGIRASVDADDALSTVDRATSAIAKARAINDSTEYTGVRAIVNATEAVAGAAVLAGNAAGFVDLDTDHNITINGELITGFRVELNDASHALTNAINSVADKTGVVATLNEAHELVLTAEDGRNIDVLVVGDAADIGLAEAVYRGSLTLQSDLQFSFDAANGGHTALGHGVDGSNLRGVNSAFAVETVDVTTRNGANIAIEILDVALSQVSSIRSDLGAVQNRLESTIGNLSTTAENITASRSRILDADFAEETAALSKNQIIQQAGVSILAQANQSSQVVLSLLG